MIVVSEAIHEDALALLVQHGEVHNDATLHQHRDALKALLQRAEALIVRNQTRVDADLIAGAAQLEVVGRLGVGLDNLELSTLQQKGITVTWAPGMNAVSVAEYVLGVMLEFSRRFAATSNALHEGRWDRFAATGSELYGKTLGIVGLGDIGTRLARRAAVMGMRLVASDPVVHESTLGVQEFQVSLTSLERLFERADFVSLHAPLTQSTQHLMNARTLALMKPDTYLINTSRGGLVDEAALARHLRAGKLAGAALDVREHEPPGKDDPLRELPNVLLTPHIAGVTHESNRRISLHVAQDVLRALRGENPLSVVG